MHRTLRKCCAHLSWLLLSALSAATASSHPATDPRSLVSPVRSDFAPASVAAISGLEDVSPPSWSPAGHSILYLSDRSGVDNIWVVDADTGKSRALAPAKQAQSGPVWSPDGKRVAFLADDAGNELYDIMVADLATGQVANLTATAGVSEEDPAWSPDGRYLAFSARAADRCCAQIEIIDLGTHSRRALTRQQLRNVCSR